MFQDKLKISPTYGEAMWKMCLLYDQNISNHAIILYMSKIICMYIQE